MSLGTVDTDKGFSAGWDWKGEYVNSLASGEGYERFAQGSMTPDTTLLYAGPARFNDKDLGKRLHPLGLVESFSYQQQAALQRLFEIGSNRSFFTRGKTQSQIQISAMLADHQNLLKAVMQESFVEKGNKPGLAYGPDSDDSTYQVNSAGTKSPGAGEFWMNLDSEAFNIPFGLMMVFKTKGQSSGFADKGTLIGACYLEYCMLSNFQFQVQAQSPIISENVAIEYDRAVPVKIA